MSNIDPNTFVLLKSVCFFVANAQYSTTVQQPPKSVAQPTGKMVQQSTGVAETKAETKKYAFLLDKGSTNTAKKPGPPFRKMMPNIIGK